MDEYCSCFRDQKNQYNLFMGKLYFCPVFKRYMNFSLKTFQLPEWYNFIFYYLLHSIGSPPKVQDRKYKNN